MPISLKVPNNALTAANLPRRFWATSAEHVRLTTTQRKVLKQYLDTFPKDTANIVFEGERRRGKTSAACLLLKQIMATRKVKAYYLTLETLTDLFFKRQTDEIRLTDEDVTYQDLKKYDVVVLDSLQGDNNAGRASVLSSFLRDRESLDLPTILCVQNSTEGLSELETDYGADFNDSVMSNSYRFPMDYDGNLAAESRIIT